MMEPNDDQASVGPADIDSETPKKEEMETWKKVALIIFAILAIVAAILIPLLLLRRTSEPTEAPSAFPSLEPSTLVPTTTPTLAPSTSSPTTNPSFSPTTQLPTTAPTVGPTSSPTAQQPTTTPTSGPTTTPTLGPTTEPTLAPTTRPTTLAEFYASTVTACPDLELDDTLVLAGNSSNSSTLISRNSTSAWTQIADDIYGESPADFSGAALALSANGRIVAVSSTENDGNGRNSGSVRVYLYNSTLEDYVQLGQEIDGESAGDWSGESVALDASGYRLAVGAGWNDGLRGEDSGHVRVFDYNEKTDSWDLVDTDLDGPSEGMEFGKSVSLSADGNRLLVGASHCRGTANMTRLGCAYLFDYMGDSWTLMGQLEGEAEGDEFGTTVEISDDGTFLAIGAYRHDVPNGTDAGQVALYSFNSSTTSFESFGAIEGVLPGEWAGMTFALSESGHRIAIGFHDRQVVPVPGFTRVYEWAGDTWIQLGTNDLTGGFSVSMSRDGSRVAVGDYRGRYNGANSGHIFVYDFNEETFEWEIVGTGINGNPQEMLGIGVAMTADGMRIAITAPLASNQRSGAAQVGATRVFDLCY